ncbi:MAG TPA: bifunctional 5,10-methylenetetrahydrofolate dehydrogenase/5,10-methenyltetrahydrofolate cyclohydrolase [Candidatus Paceibacterota bacterium]|nr:bifunctional 5,10-methylenetetrahydrofolate dehydrogenase/5,10-methenyltetrahydrofolate cyclohydrolase [Candidatus Paceibacterota bacterium]
MILDGRAIAQDVYSRLLRTQPRQKPVLGIVVGSHDKAIESFVHIKSRAAQNLGVELRRIDLPNQPTTADAIAAVEKLAPNVQGIIVQLPLPGSIDTEAVLKAIPPYLDVDAINPAVSEGKKLVLSPVAGAIEVILERYKIETSGKNCVIVGAGRLVGAPAAELLKHLGGRLSVVSLEKGDISEVRNADIIVLGAGNPVFIKPEMIKEGVVLIDAGTSESSGKIVGDADPACASKCSVFTPVPGGVGPIAVAMIFKNLYTLTKAQ